MSTIARFAQFEHRAASHDFAAVFEEVQNHFTQIEQFRLAIDQRDHVHAEGVLQLRVFVQIVQNDFGDFAAFEFDHHAHTGFIRFVADVGNAFEPLVVHHLGDGFEQLAFVDLIRQLVDDDRLTVAFFHIFKMRTRTHDHAATAGAVALTHAADAINNTGSWEIRCRDDLDQLVYGGFGIFQQMQTAFDDFAQVVWRDVGRHTDGNTGGAIDQQIRDACRQNQRFTFVTIVVRTEIDGFLVDIL